MRLSRSSLVPPLLTLLILGGLAVHTATRPTAADAEAYLARLRAAGPAVPFRIGLWTGRDWPNSPATQQTRQPNLWLGREYRNSQTGRQLDLLLVQCRDARELALYSPLVTYPDQGWTLTNTQTASLACGGWTVPEAIYKFSRAGAGSPEEILVHDVLILPDGRLTADSRAAESIAKSLRKRFFGAGRLELVLEPGVPPEESTRILVEFLEALHPTLRQIQEGIP